jgi:hypothetical protein
MDVTVAVAATVARAPDLTSEQREALAALFS